MSEAKSKPRSVDGARSREAQTPRQEKSSEEKASTAEAASEVVGEAAPPPEAVEPDPQLTPEEAERARKKYLLRRFWISARGYWSRRGDSFAWPLTIGLLILICVNVGFQYGINVWNRAIFDAIEQRNARTIYFLSAVFVPLVLGSGSLVVAQVYLRMTIQRRWRSWLTTSVIARWLANGRYY
ncbi:MAG: ABC transporter ATP-binding protein/permease, partial [Mesorhizobium sp.]